MLYIVLGTIIWSLIPLVIDKGGGDEDPFISMSLFSLSGSLGIVVYLAIWHRPELGDRDVWAAIRSSASVRKGTVRPTNDSGGGCWLKMTWDRHAFFWAAVGRLSLLLLAWSASHIEMAVAATLYEMWVIWFIVLRNFGSPDRARRLSPKAWTLVLIGFFGLALVNLAQGSGVKGLVGFGTVMALAGGFLSAVNMERSLKWGEVVRGAYQRRIPNSVHRQRSLELALTMLCVLVTDLFLSAVAFTFGLVEIIGGRHDLWQLDRDQFVWLFAGGMFVSSSAFLLCRKANIYSPRPEINTICYLAPALSVLALSAFSDINLERYSLFVLGLLILIAVNVSISLMAADRQRALPEAA